jgi:[protein-PII] uridylyltransferase
MGTRERRERSNESDRLLNSLFTGVTGVALAAVGGYGRGELSPGSDLDILFLHNGRIEEKSLAEVVNKILYPLWDKSFKVDHSVRTRSETRESASSDLKVALGLLDIRLICGDPDLVAAVQHDAIDDWRGNSRERLPELRRSLADRHLRAGDLAYLLEPDLKEARGGLRDINALRAIARSGAVSISLEHISNAESVLNNAREALHTVTSRDKDRLLFQEQDKVAELLKYADADALMSDIAQAARSVDYLLESTWHRFDHRGKDGLGRFLKKTRTTHIAQGISIAHQEVFIDEGFDFDKDPVIGLRAAAIAAQAGLPIIAPAVGSISDIVENDKTGFLTSPQPGAMASALSALSTDPELRNRLGSAGKARAHEFFSLERMLRDHTEIYNRSHNK